MKKFFLLMIVVVFQCHLLFAQKCVVAFGVADAITGEKIENSKLSLYYNDSIKVPYTMMYPDEETFMFEFDYKKGKFTIKVEKEGYEDNEKDFFVHSRRSTILGVGDIFMKKARTRNLQEVVIRPTHIKMVTRGDTVVYDAAAFDLAEGSMLDALVAQLPGAELKNGQIKVNGKFVESLLVNGEDFFSGNPKVALENLPAYTVKNIKVYDRASDDAYLRAKLGNKKVLGAEEHLVMDVTLKKHYSQGWLGNIEGGYGKPSNRYIGKGFGLGYRGKMRLAAFANLNNIKDTQMAGTYGQWDGGWPQDGELEVKMGGLDYLYSRNKAKLVGNVTLTHEKPETERKSSNIFYFNTGDIFERSYQRKNERKVHLLSSHKFQYRADHAYFEVMPSIDYMKNDYNTIRHRAQFTENPIESYRMQSLDSLFSSNFPSSIFTRKMLNRIGNDEEAKSNWFIGKIVANSTLSLSENLDQLSMSFSGNYRRDANHSLTSFHRLYGPSSAENGTGDQLWQNTDYVSKKTDFTAEISYQYSVMPYKREKLSAFQIQPALGYSYNHYDRVNTLLHLHENIATGAMVPPSAISKERLNMDLNNTYNSNLVQQAYYPVLSFAYVYIPKVGEEGNQEFQIEGQLRETILHDHLNYYKSKMDTLLTRTSQHFSPSFTFYYTNKSPELLIKSETEYSFSQSVPNIYYQLNTINDSDPTNIFKNNPHLRKSKTHTLTTNYSIFNKKRHTNLVLTASFEHTNRAVAQARTYNRATGVSTWTPQNINGNWNTNESLNFSLPFGKNEAFQFQTLTTSSFVHSVDYASDTENLERSIVKNLTLGEQLSLSYHVNKHTFGVRAGVSWLKSRSHYLNFDPISAFDLTAGANTTLNLAKNWQINSDLSFYGRRGYSDATLNKTHWVWNASLAKTICHGNLTFSVKAIDLLNQISNVQHTINAQGRTETWINAQPRYVMMNVVYRFNVIPKKKA